MRPFSMQKFLNPAGHDDSGAVVFAVSRERSREEYVPGVKGDAMFWDCTRKITLDFWVTGQYLNGDGILPRDKKKKILDEVRDRRKKVAILRKSVNAFCDAMDTALNEVVDDVNGL